MPVPREADVVMLQQGKTFEARVDLAAHKLISWQEMKDVQAPFLASEMFGADEAIKKDPLVIEALKKRGLTDFNTWNALRFRSRMRPFLSRTPSGSASRVFAAAWFLSWLGPFHRGFDPADGHGDEEGF